MEKDNTIFSLDLSIKITKVIVIKLNVNKNNSFENVSKIASNYDSKHFDNLYLPYFEI